MKSPTCIIQARLNSSRLPNKILLPFPRRGKKSILETVIERACSAKLVKKVIVATPNAKIASLCVVPVFIGSENDVLGRYYHAAHTFEASVIVRVTADCPLIKPSIIDQTVKAHLQSDADYTVNRNDNDDDAVGDGQDVEVFSVSALSRAYHKATEPYDREHVTPWIRRNCKVQKLKAPNIRTISVNTWQDYLTACRIYEEERNGSTRFRKRLFMGREQS